MRPQPSPETKVNNVNPVDNKVQESSTPSVKDRCRMFGGMANKYEKPSIHFPSFSK
ncbi:hypothetical protein [Wolbachia endosymbiont (group B) of Limnophora tigrina]|uniref:hypothetical protein n=1 Tax=Wolbachia endosymbiont (group B) of Limnophora tigrina TaxID=3139317 RepID=UPI0035B50921